MDRVPAPTRPSGRPPQRGGRRAGIVALGLVVGALAVVPPASGVGTTTLVDVTTAGTHGDGRSQTPAMSADGQVVAFVSDSTDLVPGDTNGSSDAFVRDLRTGVTTRVSVGTGGAQSAGYTAYVDISANGRWVAFQSTGGDLVAGDGNDDHDVFVHDRELGTTTLVSTSAAGEVGTSGAWNPDISADGRYVAFDSRAPQLVPGDSNGAWDVFRKDVVTGELVRIASGTSADGSTMANPSISGDGRYVAYHSLRTDVIPDDGAGTNDVFVTDLQTGTTTAVSSGGAGQRLFASISDDGGVVSFAGGGHIYAWDRTSGALVLASRSSDGDPADNSSFSPVTSPDGRYVAFSSYAGNLGASLNGDFVLHAYLRDLQDGTTELLSPGLEDDDDAYAHGISAAGDRVVLSSSSTNLGGGQNPEAGRAIYVRDRFADGDAPTVSLDQAPPARTSDATPTVVFSSDDPTATFACRLALVGAAAAASPCTSPATFGPLGEGDYLLTVTATDPSGNASDPVTHPFTVDMTAPVATITAAPPATGTDPDVSFEFTSEAGAAFSCVLETGGVSDETTCTSPTQYLDLTPGEYQFSVSATDDAGNAGRADTHAFTVTGPPEPPTLPAPSRPDLVATSDTGLSSTDDSTADTTPTLTGTAQPGTTVTVLVDGTARGSAVVPTTGANAGRWTVTTTALTTGTRVVTAVASNPGTGATSPAGESLSVQVVAATACHTATNTITGTAASNTLDGGRLADRIFGLGGNDTVNGRTANDCVVGGTGNDTLTGAVGNDELYGDDGDDRLTLGGGADTAYAGAGTDRVFARDGVRDVVDCGSGTDTATVDAVDVVTGCERVIVR